MKTVDVFWPLVALGVLLLLGCTSDGAVADKKAPLASAGQIRETSRRRAAKVLAIALAPNGRQLFAVAADGFLARWQLVPRELVDQVQIVRSPVLAAAFAGDGIRLATTSESVPRPWSFPASDTRSSAPRAVG